MSDDDLTISEVRALLGTTRRDARWHLTDELDILCLFARARFDLRQIETTGNDVVEVTVTCAFGSVDFIVPDGTMVVLDGTSFLASARSDVAAEGDSELPRIEITANTVLGRVKIVSPSHDANEELAEEVVELAVEAAPAPAAIAPAEPTPTAAAAEPVVPKPPPAAFVSNGTADDPIVPKAPPSKDTVTEESAAPAPVVPQPPANKYAVATDEPTDEATPTPVVPQPPANKYAVTTDEPTDEATPAPVVPQPPANKYAVTTDEPAPAPVVPQPPANKYAVTTDEPADEPAA